MTSQILPAFLLQSLRDLLRSRFGLDFPESKWHGLERDFLLGMREVGLTDPIECFERLQTGTLEPRGVQLIIERLTIGETYFFRDKHLFDALRANILPDLIRSRRESDEKRLRIWSAGCCTGEEPYSIAILLRQLIPDIDRWDVSILATDLNRSFLEKARSGTYGSWSFRSVPEGTVKNYFRPLPDGRFEIDRRYKSCVKFEYINLAEGCYPSHLNGTTLLDIILCRNVLMYFSQHRVTQVVRQFYRSLRDRGWLMIGPAEGNSEIETLFERIQSGNTFVYRKHTAGIEPLSIGRTSVPSVFASPGFEPFGTTDFRGGFGQSSSLVEGTIADDLSTIPNESGEGWWGYNADEIRNSDSAPVLSGEGDRLGRTGEQEESGETGSLSEKAPLDETVSKARLVRILANRGDLAEALAHCDRLIADDWLEPNSHYLRGIILLDLGEWHLATESLRRTLYLAPDFIVAHLAMGDIARRQGRRKEGRRCWRNALELSRAIPADEILPESDGLAAGRMVEIVQEILSSETWE